MTQIRRSSRASATGQRGALLRWLSAGAVDDGMLRGRIQSGRQPHPDALAALRALILDVGEPVWAYGPTAGALHTYDDFVLAPPFHLLLERGRFVSRVGHVIHTTIDLPLIDRESIFGIPVTAPARTVIDLARSGSNEEITAAFVSAIRDGGATENHLHQRIAHLRGRGRYGLPRLLQAIERHEILGAAHSWLERRLLELIAEARLPRPVCQQVLTKAKNKLVRVDVRFPGTPVVVEALGYAFHRTVDQIRRDTERMNRLVLDGHIVLQFTYTQITEEPEWVIATIVEALGLTGSAVSVST